MKFRVRFFISTKAGRPSGQGSMIIDASGLSEVSKEAMLRLKSTGRIRGHEGVRFQFITIPSDSNPAQCTAAAALF